MQNDRHGFFFALAAVLLWSTVATAFKITLSYLTPVQMVAVASSVSFVFLFAWVAVSGELKDVWPALKTHPRYYLLLGLLNPLLYYLILFQAYALLPASQAQPLNYTWAIALTFMAALFLGQKIRKRDWVACFLGYCGVLDTEHPPPRPPGDYLTAVLRIGYTTRLARYHTLALARP